MKLFTGQTGQEIYPDIVEYIRTHGEERSPRKNNTYDIGYTVIELVTPRNALPLGCGRSLNVNIAAAEAAQLIGGFSLPSLLTKASAQFTRYAEQDGNFHGAYGKRIGTQVLRVLEKLRSDPQSRQAVITLWDPWLDNIPDKNDYPCTVMLQFEMYKSRLCMNTVMRSNDVWLGLPYDMFQFTQLQMSMAYSLGIPPGYYRHTTMSLHLYSRDVDASLNLHPAIQIDKQPCGFGFHNQSFVEIMRRARAATVPATEQFDATDSEKWYNERFASYMG